MQLYAYAFHQDVCDVAINALASEGLNITQFEDTYIKVEITSTGDGLMYTSIIYDKGWTAYVDGEEVELQSINDALIAIPVPAGTHTIELKYFPTNLLPGLLITIAAWGIFIFLIVRARKNLKNKVVVIEDDADLDMEDISDIDDVDTDGTTDIDS